MSDNAMRTRALNYLSAGLNESATASALGVSIPLISSYLSDPTFAATVKARRSETIANTEELQTNYSDAQLKLSRKLTALIAEDYPWTPLELVKVSETLDKLQEKYRPQKSSEEVSNTLNILQIVMPANIVAKYTTNAQNEIIAVDDKLLRTIDSQKLIKELTLTANKESNNATNQHELPQSAHKQKVFTSLHFSGLPKTESNRTTGQTDGCVEDAPQARNECALSKRSLASTLLESILDA
jgi:predicted transcriptional regulator